MIKNKILVIAPYPIVTPEHGGQKRTKALFEYYKGIFEQAKFVGVFHRGLYPDKDKEDIFLGQPDIIEEIDKNPDAAEILSGMAIDKDIHVRSYMAKVLQEFNPEVIHVEQVFPYIGLSVLLKELNLKAKIIYGSQNVEFRLKDGIYAAKGMDTSQRGKLVAKIKAAEEEFSRNASLVLAVSESDAKAHREMGAENCIVVPNGIERVKPSKKALVHWQNIFRVNKIEHPIIFVGSGHPPNWDGFQKAFSRGLDFIPPTSKLLIAGGVSEYFKNTDSAMSDRFWKSVILLGKLKEDYLAGLISSTEVIVLPITSGGGSNLKTAEAILSGKKVVATSYAFRGFEQYSNLSNIYIVDSYADFESMVLKALASPFIERTKAEQLLADQVQWKYCLEPLQRPLKRIVFGIYLESLHIRIVASKQNLGKLVKHGLKRLKIIS